MQNLSSEMGYTGQQLLRQKLIAFRCIEGTVFAVFSLDGLLCFNPFEVQERAEFLCKYVS